MSDCNLYLINNPQIQNSTLGVIEREGAITLRVSDLGWLGLMVSKVRDFKPGTFVEIEKENN